MDEFWTDMSKKNYSIFHRSNFKRIELIAVFKWQIHLVFGCLFNVRDVLQKIVEKKREAFV